jgi:hypothetical protein
MQFIKRKHRIGSVIGRPRKISSDKASSTMVFISWQYNRNADTQNEIPCYGTNI